MLKILNSLFRKLCENKSYSQLRLTVNYSQLRQSLNLIFFYDATQAILLCKVELSNTFQVRTLNSILCSLNGSVTVETCQVDEFAVITVPSYISQAESLLIVDS